MLVSNFSIRLPSLRSLGQHCLSWKYHMYGFHINTLQVFTESSGQKQVVWSKKIIYYDQSPDWLEGSVNLNIPSETRVSILTWTRVDIRQERLETTCPGIMAHDHLRGQILG